MNQQEQLSLLEAIENQQERRDVHKAIMQRMTRDELIMRPERERTLENAHIGLENALYKMRIGVSEAYRDMGQELTNTYKQLADDELDTIYSKALAELETISEGEGIS